VELGVGRTGRMVRRIGRRQVGRGKTGDRLGQPPSNRAGSSQLRDGTGERTEIAPVAYIDREAGHALARGRDDRVRWDSLSPAKGHRRRGSR